MLRFQDMIGVSSALQGLPQPINGMSCPWVARAGCARFPCPGEQAEHASPLNRFVCSPWLFGPLCALSPRCPSPGAGLCITASADQVALPPPSPGSEPPLLAGARQAWSALSPLCPHRLPADVGSYGGQLRQGNPQPVLVSGQVGMVMCGVVV